MTTCEKCGRPSWHRTGGMGGGIMPDYETHCLKRGGMHCRIAASGRAAGMREVQDEINSLRARVAELEAAMPPDGVIEIVRRSVRNRGTCGCWECKEAGPWLSRLDAARKGAE